MPALIDLTGKRFGRLVDLERVGTNRHGRPKWLCQCDCGNTGYFITTNLRGGKTTSCGCYHREIAGLHFKTHGQTGTKLHECWKNMRKRCFMKSTTQWKYYGGRGITVCKEWLTFEPFMEWALANGYREGLSIDRKDSDGNYEPSNCQWITMSENVAKKNREYFNAKKS